MYFIKKNLQVKVSLPNGRLSLKKYFFFTLALIMLLTSPAGIIDLPLFEENFCY